MSRFAILGSVALLTLAAAAPAALGQTTPGQTTPDGAAFIQATLASIVHGFGDSQEIKGDITVVAGAGRYDVAIPEIEVATWQTGRPSTVTIAPISGTITPAAGDVYTVALSLPTNITRRELDRDPVIVTGAGTLSFTFSAASGIPSAFTLAIVGLRTSGPGTADVQLASFAIKARTVESALGPNLHDVLIAIGSKGLSAGWENGKTATLGGATVELSASGLDVAGIAAGVQTAQTLFAQAETASSSEIGGLLTQAVQAFGALPKLIDGVHVGYAIEGLDVDAEDGPIAIGSTDFRFDISGLSGDTTSVALTAGLAQLDAPVSDPAYTPYLPQHAALDVGLTGIPNGLMVGTVSGAVNAVMTGAVGDLGAAFLQGFAGVLLTSDLALDVRTLDLVSSNATLSAMGSATPDPTSPLMAAGQATIRVGGFEHAIATASAMQDGLKAAQGLTVIQALGTPETGVEGQPVRRYDIAVGSDGKVLVNGIDIAPLMAGH